MEGNESNQRMQPQNSAPCKAGCGFYGSSSSDGYCSVCFKEKLGRRLLLTDATTSQSVPSSSFSGDGIAVDSRKSETDAEVCSNNMSEEPTKNVLADNSQASLSDSTPSTTNSASSSLARPSELVEKIQPEDAATDSGTHLATSDASDERLSNHEEVPEADINGAAKRKNRCLVCKKKVGLTGFGCRCGGLFCSMHRYSDTHDCRFDYKEQGQQEIRKNNPKVTFQKVRKI